VAGHGKAFQGGTRRSEARIKMAYVRCGNDKCTWSQDDCWGKRYNPFQYLSDAWAERLLEVDLDAPLEGHFDDYMLKEEGLEGKTWRDFFKKQLERSIRKIETMKWKTEKEFKEDPDKQCPKCGGSSFIWD